MQVVPENRFGFIELESFSKQRDRLGITNDDLLRLQISICENPEIGAVVKGAGGFRKVRFTTFDSTKGKSGSYRVLYLCLRTAGIVILGAIYGKSEKGNISAAEAGGMAALAASLKDRIGRIR